MKVDPMLPEQPKVELMDRRVADLEARLDAAITRIQALETLVRHRPINPPQPKPLTTEELVSKVNALASLPCLCRCCDGCEGNN